jgi:hypothetical protein
MRLEINEPHTQLICSRTYWNNTELVLEPGEEYEFSAEGRWTDMLVHADPDGYNNWYMSLYNKFKRVPEPWFALIGSLNQSGYFLIGTKNTYTVPFDKAGTLYCFANDMKGFYWNNSGKIILTITRKK